MTDGMNYAGTWDTMIGVSLADDEIAAVLEQLDNVQLMQASDEHVEALARAYRKMASHITVATEKKFIDVGEYVQDD